MSLDPRNTDYIALFMERSGLSEQSGIVNIYHAVRNIPYESSGERTIEAVIQSGHGSCSGKHILLRDVLRRLNYNAYVETVKGDFTSRLPACESMPDRLKDMCEEGGILDFHHYVVWESPNGEQTLDATWSDNPIAHGVPGNREWSGQGNTDVAVVEYEILAREEELSNYKRKLVSSLIRSSRERRLSFLNLLTNWTTSLENKGHTE